jgi:hypothetical protein
MKSNFLSILPVLGCLALASCYPIPDRQRGSQDPVQNADQSITSQDQQKIKEQRDRMKERAEQKEEIAERNTDRIADRETTAPAPTAPKGKDYPYANPIPGKQGFVFNPYNNNPVDVRGIPSGTLVQDPTQAASERKSFRVP